MDKADKFVFGFSLAVCAAASLYLGVLADKSPAPEAPVKAAVYATQTGMHDGHLATIQANCFDSLNSIEASMSEEARAEVPLEVWQSAYNQCMIDNNATI